MMHLPVSDEITIVVFCSSSYNQGKAPHITVIRQNRLDDCEYLWTKSIILITLFPGPIRMS